LAVTASCELSEVGIGNLPMTDDASKLNVCERDTVRPKFVAVSILHCADNFLRGRRRLPGA
jgi:hypothetical protein